MPRDRRRDTVRKQKIAEVTLGVKMYIRANKTRKQASPEVFHPGELVADELEARGWSLADLAKAARLSAGYLNEVVAGKRSVTPETARGLAKAFGTDAQIWMNLENAYQEWIAAR